MVKGLEKRKASRKANKDANAKLKNKKNWYPVADIKGHFKRVCKKPHASHVQKQLVPGQIVILLSGRFRGRRVIYLKNLKSGLLLVTGPYKYNGVPLKRVNAAYVLPTSTKVKIDAKAAESVTDELFKKVDIDRKTEKDFFEETKTKQGRIDAERKKQQTAVDTVVKTAVDAVPMLKEYLKNRFALKYGDMPHNMKF